MTLTMFETLDGFSLHCFIPVSDILGVNEDPPTKDFLVVFLRAEMICTD